MLVDESSRDCDNLVVLTKGEATNHEEFVGGVPEFLNSPGAPDDPRLIAYVIEGVTPPPSQSDRERSDRGSVIAPSRLQMSLVQLLLEERHIDLVGTCDEYVSRSLGPNSVSPQLVP
jgi:hypothetical protein